MIILAKILMFLIVIDIWFADKRLLFLLKMYSSLYIQKSKYRGLNFILDLLFCVASALVIYRMNLDFLFKE